MDRPYNEWVDALVEEIKASGLPIEEWVDDVILRVKADPPPGIVEPLAAIFVLKRAFGVGLGVAKCLVGLRCHEMGEGGTRDPNRVKEIYAQFKDW